MLQTCRVRSGHFTDLDQTKALNDQYNHDHKGKKKSQEQRQAAHEVDRQLHAEAR